MTFTYEGTAAGGTITSDLSRVRFEIGDTVEDTALFTDGEINLKLSDHAGAVLATSAALCDILARRFGRAYDFETDGQRFYRSQMSKRYTQLATELRQRADGLVTHATTKVDGYSDDIDYQETGVSTPRRGRVRAGYFDPDLPY